MSLFSRLGSFARKVWGTIRGVAQPIREAIGIGRKIGIEPDPYALLREYRHTVRLEGLKQQVSDISLSDFIPRELHTEADVPWKHRFAYQVTISGRDLATGRFARTERWLTFSRELEVGEIMQEATLRFGAEGAYPQLSVTHMSVTAAQTRAGEWA